MISAMIRLIVLCLIMCLVGILAMINTTEAMSLKSSTSAHCLPKGADCTGKIPCCPEFRCRVNWG
ncbi:unnamed protein product, partial [Rotaria sp. Silwood1]